MPSRCCIIGCKGNYPCGPKVHVFRFPRKEELKRKWICAIPRKNFMPTKHSRVCERHFKENEIIREATGYDEKTGRTLSAPLKYVKLSSDAVPSKLLIFPNIKLSSSRNFRRKSPDERRKKLDDVALQQALTESLHIKAKYDAENEILDNVSSDLPIITSVESYAHHKDEWVESDLKPKDLPIITLVKSYAHHKDECVESDLKSKDKFVWKHDAIQLLIEHYCCHRELFESGYMKKEDLWQKIAQSMQKHGVTGEMCEEKWHSLFSIYKKCVENKIIGNGCKCNTWDYYEQFHELYWREIMSILDSQRRLKLNVGIQATSHFNQCNSLEGEPTCFSATSSLIPLSTDSSDILSNVSAQRKNNLETDDGPLLHFLKEKHKSDTQWQLQMKELMFKSVKIQEQTNEAINRLITHIHKH